MNVKPINSFTLVECSVELKIEINCGYVRFSVSNESICVIYILKFFVNLLMEKIENFIVGEDKI